MPYNEAGQKVLAYNVHRCWVSEFQAMPDLDGSGKAIVIESLTLENEGWERDTGVTGPGRDEFQRSFLVGSSQSRFPDILCL